jgi:hypothetical protein
MLVQCLILTLHTGVEINSIVVPLFGDVKRARGEGEAAPFAARAWEMHALDGVRVAWNGAQRTTTHSALGELSKGGRGEHPNGPVRRRRVSCQNLAAIEDACTTLIYCEPLITPSVTQRQTIHPSPPYSDQASSLDRVEKFDSKSNEGNAVRPVAERTSSGQETQLLDDIGRRNTRPPCSLQTGRRRGCRG